MRSKTHQPQPASCFFAGISQGLHLKLLTPSKAQYLQQKIGVDSDFPKMKVQISTPAHMPNLPQTVSGSGVHIQTDKPA